MEQQEKPQPEEGRHDLTIELETERLILQRPTPQDEEMLLHLWLEEGAQHMAGEAFTQEEASRSAASILSHWEKYGFGCWCVYEQRQEELSGFCGLKHAEGDVELIYSFAPESWGRGIAAEAATASLAYGFRTLTLKRVIALTQQGNEASQRMLEEIGMRYIEDIVKWDAPQSVYAITRAEWAELRAAALAHA